MASRKGNVITGEGLLEEVKSHVPQQNEEVAVGAVKYALLKHGVGNDIEFDIKSSISLEGNSGPYVQYTYARTQSVVRKSGELGKKVKGVEYRLNMEEERVVRWLARWPETVEEAMMRFAPNLVCNYLFELAQRFNTFYNQHSILSADSVLASWFRLQMTRAVGQVIGNGLGILGIETVEKM